MVATPSEIYLRLKNSKKQEHTTDHQPMPCTVVHLPNRVGKYKDRVPIWVGASL